MSMPPPPPSGQGPVDPRGAFSPPPPPPRGMVPPPMPFIPPMYFPPPPRGGGFVRGIFVTLATSIFGLSIALNVYLLFASGLLGGDDIQQRVLHSGDATQEVAVVRIDGIILDGMANRFDLVMRHVESQAHPKALVVEINTPGGEVGASDAIYNRIMKFKEAEHIPVIVSMGAFATSGGYYIACAADQIVATRTTITGNIGVLWPRYDLSKLADKWGIDDATVFPTSAPYKPMGSPIRPISEMEHAYWLGLVEDAYKTFQSVVTTGRGKRLTAGMDVIANGKAYSASESKDLGLVDQIGYPDDAYALAAAGATLKDPNIVRYEYSPSIFESIGGGESSQSSLASLNVNGVTVKLDRHLLDELSTPRLMYMWRGQ